MKRLLFGMILSVLALFSGPAHSEDAAGRNNIESMVLIPAGVYEMGSRRSLMELDPADLFNTDRHALGPENPAHEVHIDALYIDIYEVTNADYAQYVKSAKGTPSELADDPDFNGPRQPVVGVAWKDAQKYCAWKGKRLPTEAEWEKASRGKRPVRYPWGNEPPDKTHLNYNEEVNKTTPVGSYEKGKSDYGVYDLAGNVSEWVQDWHLPEYYVFSPKKNPQGAEKGQYRVIRGGNWRNNAGDTDMIYRNATVPRIRNKTIGFRCAKSAE